MITITIDEIKQITNLSKVPDITIESRLSTINELIKDITIRRTYNLVVRATANSHLERGGREADGVLPSKTQLIIEAFKIAFSYFLYAEIIEVLNTNTNAAGIITHTGFTGSNSPNIQQNESWERRNLLELKAYETIRKYLTPTAYLRYQELKTWDDLRRAGNSLAQRQLISNSAGNTKATLI